jgi:non-canonical purine NTP pyrophosphatase, rdgB/HAM1 family
MILKIITSNPGKVKEFAKMLSELNIETEHCKVSYDEVQTSELEEVVKKGIEELRKKGLKDFIIDDSGLFVNALKGFPGVYSAYVQKTLGNNGLLKQMEEIDDRNAEFKCCIGCDLSGKTMIVTGTCQGKILFKEQGTEGFGFDPIFSHDGERSFAEIPIDEKNEVSHRGNALQLLIEELKKQGLKP